MSKHKIAIVGAGPAGYAAAIYTGRAEIDTTLYTGQEPGGQLTKTTEIENYPGIMGKTGPELMLSMQEQATKFGAKMVYEVVKSIKSSVQNTKYTVVSDAGETEYDGVILAMGASPRLMGVGEERYWGKGFSTCAVCDSAFYKNKKVYVIGGGDAAIEDAMALTKFAREVTLVVRSDQFRASMAMQKRIEANKEKVKVMFKTKLVGIKGEKVEKLQLVTDGVESEVEAEGLFFAIGHIPATGFLKDSDIKLDEAGYVLVGNGGWPTMTSVTGVFACGDCSDHRYRQAATAAGMGVMAALDIERWLESRV